MPAEADVVEGFAEESDETHTLWISRGDGSNGGNRKKFAWTWTLVRCPRGWTYCRIRTCCYNYRVIYAKAMNKAPIKAIKKETASLLASLFFYRFGSGHFTNARERTTKS